VFFLIKDRWLFSDKESMKKIITIIISVLLAGCVAASKKQISALHIDGESPAGADQIKKELTRGDSVLGAYAVEAYPLTKAFLLRDLKERGKRSLEADDVTNSKVSDAAAIYEKQSCFGLTVHGLSLEAAQFKHWAAKVESADGKLHDLKFIHGTSKVSVYGGGLDLPYHGDSINGTNWHNTGYACGPKISFANGFKLHMISLINKGTRQATMEWSAP
jgi:hypothetical protein